MAFHSPLETLRKLRYSEERQQELLLLQINQRVSALQLAIGDLKNTKREMRNRELLELEGRLYGAELHFDVLCLSALDVREKELDRKLVAELAARQTRMQAFRLARQRRETVETLVNHQREESQKREARKNQQIVDEMFVLRSKHRG